MHPSKNPSANRQYRERNDIPRDLDVGHESLNEPVGTASSEAELYAESPPMAPQGRMSPPYSDFGRRKLAYPKPPIGRRMLRSVTRFCFAVLLGIGATLAWQSYGRDAELMARAWVPAVDPLLPAATSGSPEAAPATVADLAQQLKPVSLDLAIVRRSLEQLAANQGQFAASQQQIAQSVATVQQLAEEIGKDTHISPRTPHRLRDAGSSDGQ